MNISVALRTSDLVNNVWNVKRFIDVSKQTLLLTCLNSLLAAIETSKHNITFSIHDDNSSDKTLSHIDRLCAAYNVPYELFRTERMGNFISQYEWTKKQTTDYHYCVEDDFLHKESCFNDMVDMIDYIKAFVRQPGADYAIYPWNAPQRYMEFEYMYPVMLFKHRDKYWKSDMQSTHTFFVSRKTFTTYDKMMQFQAYNWPKEEAWDRSTICKIWEEQRTRLLVPLDSLAYHMSDYDMPETSTLWKEFLYEIR